MTAIASGSSVTEAVDSLVNSFAELVTQAPAPSLPVPATPAWTVGDVATHLVTAVRRYAEGPRGQGEWVNDPGELPALNDRLIHEQSFDSPQAAAAALRAEAAALLKEIARFGPAQPSYRFNGGQRIRADQALGVLVGELLVHGHDIAETTGAPWPVTCGHVGLVLEGLEAVLPGWVDPRASSDHTASYDIRVRGGTRHHWRFDHGRLDCHHYPIEPSDCHISADPEALLLIMYGRSSPWRAALSGRVAAWGHRAWLALSLPGRFYRP